MKACPYTRNIPNCLSSISSISHKTILRNASSWNLICYLYCTFALILPYAHQDLLVKDRLRGCKCMYLYFPNWFKYSCASYLCEHFGHHQSCRITVPCFFLRLIGYIFMYAKLQSNPTYCICPGSRLHILKLGFSIYWSFPAPLSLADYKKRLSPWNRHSSVLSGSHLHSKYSPEICGFAATSNLYLREIE